MSLSFVAIKVNFALTEINLNDNNNNHFLKLCYAFLVVYPHHCLSYMGSLLKFHGMSLILKRVMDDISFVPFL